MRSDFLGDCTQFPGLAEAINAGQYLVPRMTRDERRAAIEGPVGVGGAEIAPVLLTRLVNDVGDNPDQLSILQHALNRTWARWQSERVAKGRWTWRIMRPSAPWPMRSIGMRSKAYAELGSARQQQICEKLFKALTDKATDPRGVRRPTTLGTLCALADATAAEVTDVIDVFRKPSRSFLMPPAGDELEPETVIDISHESLMRVWQRLIKWADEEARSARTYRRLAERQPNCMRPATQICGAIRNCNWRSIGATRTSRTRHGPRATIPDSRRPCGFLTAEQRGARGRAGGTGEQRQREREAEREKAEAQARNARRLFRAAMATGAVAVVAIIAGVVAIYYFEQANKASLSAKEYLSRVQITESRSLVKTAEQNPEDQTTEILLGLEALPDSREGIDRPFVFGAHKILADGVDDLLELAVIGGRNGSVRVWRSRRTGATSSPARTTNGADVGRRQRS